MPFWNLAIVENSLEEILNGARLNIRVIRNPYKDRWFADPFILRVDSEELTLLVEEFLYSKKKGRIVKIVVDRCSLNILERKTILEEEGHLSFPFIFRKNDKIFVLPERSQQGGLNVYEYDEANESCKFIKCLCQEPLVDAVYSEILGYSMIFATRIPEQNGYHMGIWKRNERLGTYFKDESIGFQERLGRNAGGIFACSGNYFRAAQECNQWYGHAVSLQKITISGDGMQLEEVRRLTYKDGLHTFNTHNGVSVVDVKQFKVTWLSKLVYLFHEKKDL